MIFLCMAGGPSHLELFDNKPQLAKFDGKLPPADLLKGYRATTHWLSLDLLPLVGAIPVDERVVKDRNRITSAGITADIDFALALVGEISGPQRAAEIELMLAHLQQKGHAEHEDDPLFSSKAHCPTLIHNRIDAAARAPIVNERQPLPRP